MTNSRPDSMIIPSGVFDETNTNNISQKISSITTHGHSSSSSIDSTNGKNINFNENNSLPQNILNTTTSSTTTDSDLESEQDDNSLQSQQQKNNINTQEQLSRRVKHFYKLFKSEIKDDMPDLIDSYVCAYQGDILLQGKMYITNRYLCFHSRIISYVTKHVYRWEQIEYVTKERVAFIFPTAIGIQLKKTGKKIIYASFLQRDQAYEKILSIWSRFTNDTNSLDDDETQNGTLKARNTNDKIKYLRHNSYDGTEEQEEVLQMYLKQNNNNKRGTNSLPLNPKRDSKKSNKKISGKISLPNNINENISNTTRHSRYTKNEQKQNGTTKKNNSLRNHRSQSTPLKAHQSPNRDRTLSPIHKTLSHSNSSLTLIPNINPTTTINTNQNGFLIKIFNIIFSLINIIIQYILTLFQHFQKYSIKITMIILLFLIILFFHSFYLIKLAYRIENRLQSLHHQWPSSSIRNSFSSNAKEL